MDIIMLCFTAGLFLIKTTFVFGAAGRYNAALGKPTWQSSDYNDVRISSRGVDGCKSTEIPHSCCTHTSNTIVTWWSVDLLTNHTVHELNITNNGYCCGNRMRNFTIYSSFDSHDPTNAKSLITCAYYPGVMEEGATETIKCQQPIQARYIIIKKTFTGSEATRYLTICEVEVEADCIDGRYGESCLYICSSQCKNFPCDKISGHCPGSLCKAGYMGSKCTTECSSGWYGENCQYRCSTNCAGTCDKFSAYGSCDAKCLPGYIGDNCTTACSPGQYGNQCKQTCSRNCKNEFCDASSGVCVDGCKNGWHGDMCDQECAPGFYGENCARKCSPHCLQPCDKYSLAGLCDGNCATGYTGPSCFTEISEQSSPTWLVALFSVSFTLFTVMTVVAVIALCYCMKLRKKYRCEANSHNVKPEGSTSVTSHSNEGFAGVSVQDVKPEIEESSVYETPKEVVDVKHLPYQNLKL